MANRNNMFDSNITEWTDGEVLYANDLNDTFNANITTIVPGDGSDGSRSITTNTDEGTSIDVNYTNLTIDAGVTWTVGSNSIIRVSGTLTLNGTIEVDTGAAGGAGGTQDGDGGDGGGCVYIGCATIVVGSSGQITATGQNGTDGTGSPTDANENSNDGTGGTLYGHSYSELGGKSDNTSNSTVTPYDLSFVPREAYLLNANRFIECVKNDVLSGGGGSGGQHRGWHPGGAGGACLYIPGGNGGSGINGDGDSSDTVSGGGGGGAGGVVFLFYNSQTTISNLTVQVNGGNGGAGGFLSVSGIDEQGGGGGGGAGGIAVLKGPSCDTITFTANGGSGGAGVGNAEDGTSGTDGIPFYLKT